MKCTILIAAPAAGKGTIAKYLQDKYNFKHLSTGNLLRNEIKKNTELGIKVSSLVNRGLLVSDDVIEEIVEKNLEKLDGNIVLDGYPRNIKQAKLLDKFVKTRNIEIDKVIFIDVDKEIAIDRIVNRITCEDCGSVYNSNIINDLKCIKCGGNLVSRIDDTKENYLIRYNQFIEETMPLVDYYKEGVITIYNDKTIEDMYLTIDELLEGDE